MTCGQSATEFDHLIQKMQSVKGLGRKLISTEYCIGL